MFLAAQVMGCGWMMAPLCVKFGCMMSCARHISCCSDTFHVIRCAAACFLHKDISSCKLWCWQHSMK
jgi:hypothetical protein